jgi:tRNA-2-methylthio-N6-dimethylallyladenosine synthase
MRPLFTLPPDPGPAAPPDPALGSRSAAALDPAAEYRPAAPQVPAAENCPAAPVPGTPPGVYVHTFGCQMNEYESAKLLEQLRRQGYRPVAQPDDADVVLVNTCAIREKSEHKLDTLLGILAEGKARRPGQVLGVAGCVAQERGAGLLRQARQVDFVLGTDNLFELPDALRRAQAGERVVRVQWHPADRDPQRGGKKVRNFIPAPPESGADATEPWTDAQGAPSVVAQLAIAKGCDNFCTFCIVPYTRGREVCREPDAILAEARALVARGVREITLLGQNVNSYRACGVDFVALLERLGRIEGLARLRYTSPHPKDFHERLAQAHRDLPALCEHLHLPVQSGSDRILRAMRRNHTAREYLERIARARDSVPGLAVTSDLIVGFPGETEADFEATLDVMRAVRFDQVYAFKFSPRLRTPAAALADPVPEPVKAERLARLFDLHVAIAAELNAARVGTRQEVLVEGPARAGEPLAGGAVEGGAVAGRTRGNTRTTVLDCPAPAGSLVPVDIVAARRFALIARAVGAS